MCGIIANFDGRRPLPGELFHQSLEEVVSRRGPEGTKAYHNKESGVRLGHSMLALSEVGCNEQPYLYAKNGHKSALVFNGEIYNWKELAKKFKLSSTTDTQTLLQGLVEVGPDFLKHVRGQFGFIAQVNTNGKAKYLVGRDRYGIVPLGFASDEHGNVGVASTWEALLKAGYQHHQLRSFPHGTLGVIEGGKMTINTFTKTRGFRGEKRLAARVPRPLDLRNLLVRNIREQIPQDPSKFFVAFGGKDSASITATVARATKGKFGGAITIVSEDDKNGGDLPGVLETVKMLEKEGIKINHYVGVLTTGFAKKRIDHLLNLLGPSYFNLECALAEDAFAHVAKKHGAKAMMTAGGPDEAFYSYAHVHARVPQKQRDSVFDALNRQFADTECIRAGLVLGEHGLENRVPYAFLTEYARRIPQKYKWGIINGKLETKILFRQALKGIIPESLVNVQKETIRSATGAGRAIARVIAQDGEFQAKKAEIISEVLKSDWKMILTQAIKDPREILTEPKNTGEEASKQIALGQVYVIWRWGKNNPEMYKLGARKFFGRPTKGIATEPAGPTASSQCFQCRDWYLPKAFVKKHFEVKK